MSKQRYNPFAQNILDTRRMAALINMSPFPRQFRTVSFHANAQKNLKSLPKPHRNTPATPNPLHGIQLLVLSCPARETLTIYPKFNLVKKQKIDKLVDVFSFRTAFCNCDKHRVMGCAMEYLRKSSFYKKEMQIGDFKDFEVRFRRKEAPGPSEHIIEDIRAYEEEYSYKQMEIQLNNLKIIFGEADGDTVFRYIAFLKFQIMESNYYPINANIKDFTEDFKDIINCAFISNAR